MKTDLIPDQILDQALTMFCAGESVVSISEKFPEYKSEIIDWLNIVALLQAVPKAEAPAPTKRYRFAEKVSVWSKLASTFNYYRLASVPLALIMMVASAYVVVSASENSLPGDRLYSLKIASEKAKLSLTFDQNKIAKMQVELAQKRIEETKAVIAINNPNQEAAAINALTKQTEQTFTAVSGLAATKAVSENNPELLENLVAINKEQKSVLQTVSESENSIDVPESAITISKANDKSLAELIATVNEQSLLSLPNKISVTGVLTSNLNSKVTVERNVFTLNQETVITGADGELLTDTTAIKGKITVIGTREGNNLIAKKIVIIDPEEKLPAPVITKPAVTPVAPAPVETPVPEPETNEVLQPSEATAGFIAEPSSSQYSR